MNFSEFDEMCGGVAEHLGKRSYACLSALGVNLGSGCSGLSSYWPIAPHPSIPLVRLELQNNVQSKECLNLSCLC